MRVLYVCNDLAYFDAHRAMLADAARQAGWEVHVASGGIERPELRPEIAPLEVTRHSFSPRADIRLAGEIARLARRVDADVVHLITIKPILLGAIGLRLASGRARVVATFPGLGRVFDRQETSAKARLRRMLVAAGLRFGLAPRTARVIVETEADRAALLAIGVASPQRVTHIPGAGVDPQVFAPRPLPDGPARILFAGRLLKSKGIGAVAEAARLTSGRVEFVVAGLPQPDDPDGLAADDVAHLAMQYGFRHIGAVPPERMPDLIASCHAVALPTVYQEGVPRILIEAAAVGRPSIVSDNPGCVALIRGGENGLVLRELSGASLAAAAIRLSEEPGLLEKLASGARRSFLEGGFALREVAERSLALYRS